jgi:hypothetical protein
MPIFYLNSYVPLVATKVGRDASARFDILPFVDGSIRREPDLEHEFPAISCLCRAGNFAPRLKPRDIVGYMLCKSRYGLDHDQRRLTAILRVIQVFPNHSAGAQWYNERDLPLPNNCWIHGNAARPLAHSHRRNRNRHLPDAEFHKYWDLEYRARAMKHGTFVICERLFVDLSWDAPEVTEPQLEAVFGYVPGTLNPGAWQITHAEHLLRLLQIDAPLSAR